METKNPLAREHTMRLVEIMQMAGENINYPRMRFQIGEQKVVFALAGQKSTNRGGINITDGRPYGSNLFFGKISSTGSVKWSKPANVDNMGYKIEGLIRNFAENPAGVAKLYGTQTGSCMFCGLTLTDPQSVAVGYGPVCAANYGLPHGNIDAEVAQDMASFEFDMPISESEQNNAGATEFDIINSEETLLELPVEMQAAYLFRRIKMLEALVYKMQTEGF